MTQREYTYSIDLCLNTYLNSNSLRSMKMNATKSIILNTIGGLKYALCEIVESVQHSRKNSIEGGENRRDEENEDTLKQYIEVCFESFLGDVRFASA